jgi:hypothetical protein
MVAPRGVMMYSGYAESAANPLGFEQAYRSALNVYRLHGREQNLWLNLREGEHGTRAEDVETFIDFFDSVFGRQPRPKAESWIHGYDFDRWKKLTGEKVDLSSFPVRKPGDFVVDSPARWNERKGEIRNRIAWALGEAAPQAPLMCKLLKIKWSGRVDSNHRRWNSWPSPMMSVIGLASETIASPRRMFFPNRPPTNLITGGKMGVTMKVTIDLPEDVSAALKGRWDDVPRRSLEAIAVESYRIGALTEAQVRRLLQLETRVIRNDASPL